MPPVELEKISPEQRALALQLIFRISSKCANRAEARQAVCLIEQQMGQIFRFMEHVLDVWIYEKEEQSS